MQQKFQAKFGDSDVISYLPKYLLKVLKLIARNGAKVSLETFSIITQVHAEVCDQGQSLRTVVPQEVQILFEAPPSKAQLLLKYVHHKKSGSSRGHTI
jgi:hypothetical protein